MIVLQGPADRWEGEIEPRDFVPVEETDFEALGPRRDGFVEQPRAKDQLHLANSRDVVDRQQPFDLDPRARFFPGLALGARTGGFVELKIARGQGPETVTRLDRTAE